MISPVLNEAREFDVSFTLGYETTESGFLKFRFEFRPLLGFWLESEWFIPPTSEPETIRLFNRMCCNFPE